MEYSNGIREGYQYDRAGAITLKRLQSGWTLQAGYTYDQEGRLAPNALKALENGVTVTDVSGAAYLFVGVMARPDRRAVLTNAANLRSLSFR